MKYWYYAKDDQQLGPFTIEELKSNRLRKSTLVWAEGMDDWASANTIDELKDILVSEPPPLPRKPNTEPSSMPHKSNIKSIGTVFEKPSSTPIKPDKYDRTYEKETGAAIVGVILILFSLGPLIAGVYIEPEIRGPLGVLSMIVKIAVTIWVVNIAERQNRNSIGWGFFAFFFSGIALIIIGLLNKLKRSTDEPNLISTIEEEDQGFRGNYLLEASEVYDKIGQQDYIIYPFKYNSGLTGIEIVKDLTIEQPAFQLHKKGFHIELKTKDKRYHNLVISFHEINDISYRKANKLITCHLSDDNTLIISYEPETDFYRGLKTLCTKYNQVTGKVPSALDALK